MNQQREAHQNIKVATVTSSHRDYPCNPGEDDGKCQDDYTQNGGPGLNPEERHIVKGQRPPF